MLPRVSNLILQPWPVDGAGLLSNDPIKNASIIRNIQLIESRLVLLRSMIGDSWNNPNLQVPIPHAETRSTVTPFLLLNCNLNLNAAIVEWCSLRDLSQVRDFPFHQVMCKLLDEKLKMTSNPLIRTIYQAALKGAYDGKPAKALAPVMHPEELNADIFFFYTVYGVILKWVDFSEWKIPEFEKNWCLTFEPTVFSLLSYSFLSKNRIKHVNITLERMSESLKIWSNLHTVYDAISRVYGNLSDHI